MVFHVNQTAIPAAIGLRFFWSLKILHLNEIGEQYLKELQLSWTELVEAVNNTIERGKKN